MKRLAGSCNEATPTCPGIHDDGDPDTVIVVGRLLLLKQQVELELRQGPGEVSVRIPRSLILQAAEAIKRGAL